MKRTVTLFLFMCFFIAILPTVYANQLLVENLRAYRLNSGTQIKLEWEGTTTATDNIVVERWTSGTGWSILNANNSGSIREYLNKTTVQGQSHQFRLTVKGESFLSNVVNASSAPTGETNVASRKTFTAVDKDGNTSVKSGFPLSRLTDGNKQHVDNNYWISDDALGYLPDNPVTLEVDLGDIVSINKVNIVPRRNIQTQTSYYGPKDFAISVSTDGIDFGDPIATITNHLSAQAGTPVNFDTNYDAQYVRIRITASHTTNSSNVQIREIEIFSNPSAVIDTRLACLSATPGLFTSLFDSNTTDYILEVAENTQSVALKAHLADYAACNITIDGSTPTPDPVPDNTNGHNYTISLLSDFIVIPIVVSEIDNVSNSKTYNVTITRNKKPFELSSSVSLVDDKHVITATAANHSTDKANKIIVIAVYTPAPSNQLHFVKSLDVIIANKGTIVENLTERLPVGYMVKVFMFDSLDIIRPFSPASEAVIQ